MDIVGRGIVAGFIAMLVLSGLLDSLVMITRSIWSSAPALGWQLHFFVAPVIWGALFAFFHDHVGGPSWLRGVVFAGATWWVLVLFAPGFADAGGSSIGLGAGTPAAILLLHVAYGALLGTAYGGLKQRDLSASSGADGRLQSLVC
jgi:hypothetical protein